MIEPGRICVKLAGRDAGKKCVVVDVKDDRVLIDGETRRRYCNARHLLPLKETINLKKGASHDVVVKAFASHGTARTTKPRNAAERPKRERKKKVSPVKPEQIVEKVEKPSPKA